MRRARVLVVAVLLLVLAVPAAASESGADRRGGGPGRVRMVASLRFRPRTLTIQTGTRVRWTNASGVHHTTTSDTGVWDSGHMPPGDTFSRRFRSEGTFRYHCTIHASMRGTIVVT